jgi:hypothetical protein
MHRHLTAVLQLVFPLQTLPAASSTGGWLPGCRGASSGSISLASFILVYGIHCNAGFPVSDSVVDSSVFTEDWLFSSFPGSSNASSALHQAQIRFHQLAVLIVVAVVVSTVVMVAAAYYTVHWLQI